MPPGPARPTPSGHQTDHSDTGLASTCLRSSALKAHWWMALSVLQVWLLRRRHPFRRERRPQEPRAVCPATPALGRAGPARGDRCAKGGGRRSGRAGHRDHGRRSLHGSVITAVLAHRSEVERTPGRIARRASAGCEGAAARHGMLRRPRLRRRRGAPHGTHRVTRWYSQPTPGATMRELVEASSCVRAPNGKPPWSPGEEWISNAASGSPPQRPGTRSALQRSPYALWAEG